MTSTTTRHHQNVVDLLLVQHSRMRELVDEMLSASDSELREPLEELARLLAVHEATEAALLHTAARSG